MEGPMTPQIEGLIEEGEAFNRLRETTQRKRIGVIVIGAGQAGLSVGYHLKKLGLEFIVIDANTRIGDSWRQRWDSLRLFTPNRFNGLDGMPFPGPRYAYPTKDEMADYLESYAAHYQLPVLHGVRVNRLWREDNRYLVDAGSHHFEADHVVVAMASYQGRKVPAFAKELSPEIVQLHSCEYKSLSQLRPGGVLIVGTANSGAEIAMETCADASDVDCGPRRRLDAIQHQELLGPARRAADALPRGVSPHPHGRNADGTQGAREDDQRRLAADPSAAHRTGQRGRALGRQSHRREGRTPAAGQRPQPRCAPTSSGARVTTSGCHGSICRFSRRTANRARPAASSMASRVSISSASTSSTQFRRR